MGFLPNRIPPKIGFLPKWDSLSVRATERVKNKDILSQLLTKIRKLLLTPDSLKPPPLPQCELGRGPIFSNYSTLYRLIINKRWHFQALKMGEKCSHRSVVTPPPLKRVRGASCPPPPVGCLL